MGTGSEAGSGGETGMGTISPRNSEIIQTSEERGALMKYESKMDLGNKHKGKDVIHNILDSLGFGLTGIRRGIYFFAKLKSNRFEDEVKWIGNKQGFNAYNENTNNNTVCCIFRPYGFETKEEALDAMIDFLGKNYVETISYHRQYQPRGPSVITHD